MRIHPAATTLILFQAALLGLPLHSANGALNPASLGAPFENTASTARATGMGGALYFSDGDASLMIVNPSALAAVTHSQVALHHNNWIADVLQECVILGLRSGDWGMGISANYVNYGHFQGRDEKGRITGGLGASDLGLGLSVGKRLVGSLDWGITIKALQQTLADATYTTYSGDAGLQLGLPGRLSLSAVYANLGTTVGGSQRATVLRLGGAWEAIHADDLSLRIGGGAHVRPLGESQAQLGAESVFGLFALRAGYSFPFESNDLSGLRGLAVGGGATLGSVKIDYSYLPFGELGSVQRLSVGYDFGEEPAPKPRSAPVQASPAPAPQPTPLPLARPVQTPPPSPVATPAPSNGVEFVTQVPVKGLEEARSHSAAGRFKEAVDAYSQVLQAAPEDSQAWREMGDLYFKAGRTVFALRCYEEVVKLDPSEIELKAWISRTRAKIEPLTR